MNSKEDTFLILKYGGVENAYRYYLETRQIWDRRHESDYEKLHTFFRNMDYNRRIELYYATRDRVVEDGS